MDQGLACVEICLLAVREMLCNKYGFKFSLLLFYCNCQDITDFNFKNPFEGTTVGYLQEEIYGRKEMVNSEIMFFTYTIQQACFRLK